MNEYDHNTLYILRKLSRKMHTRATRLVQIINKRTREGKGGSIHFLMYRVQTWEAAAFLVDQQIEALECRVRRAMNQTDILQD